MSPTPREMIVRWARRPVFFDSLIAIVCAPPIVFEVIALAPGEPQIAWAPLGLLFAAPLVWRRSRPQLFGVGIAVATLVQLLVYDSPLLTNFTAAVAIYAVTAYTRRLHRVPWAIAVLLGALLAAADWSGLFDTVDRANARFFGLLLGFNVAVLATAWCLGELGRQRQLAMSALLERAEMLERNQTQRVQLAEIEERARIAREMHDVVAHSLSVIVVQADGGRYVVGQDELPANARVDTAAKTLSVIAQTARGALSETRRLVGVLHSDDQAGLRPQATLAQIGDLVDRLGDAGVTAEFAVEGSPEQHPPLTSGAEMAAYRVVQESLTNVLKHAGSGATVRVTLAHEPDGIRLVIADTGVGRSAAAPTDGHGEIGMRQRVGTWGGSLTSRNRVAGGYEVIATLPGGERGSIR